jgi:hypothetical protein
MSGKADNKTPFRLVTCRHQKKAVTIKCGRAASATVAREERLVARASRHEIATARMGHQPRVGDKS